MFALREALRSQYLTLKLARIATLTPLLGSVHHMRKLFLFTLGVLAPFRDSDRANVTTFAANVAFYFPPLALCVVPLSITALRDRQAGADCPPPPPLPIRPGRKERRKEV